MYKNSLRIKAKNVHELIEIIKKGLPFSSFEILCKQLGVSQKEMASIVNISPRTLSRRKKEGRLKFIESDKIFYIAIVIETANRVLGGMDESKRWFHTPVKSLGFRTPLEYCEYFIGLREVENVLGRIEHGQAG